MYRLSELVQGLSHDEEHRSPFRGEPRYSVRDICLKQDPVGSSSSSRREPVPQISPRHHPTCSSRQSPRKFTNNQKENDPRGQTAIITMSLESFNGIQILWRNKHAKTRRGKRKKGQRKTSSWLNPTFLLTHG